MPDLQQSMQIVQTTKAQSLEVLRKHGSRVTSLCDWLIEQVQQQVQQQPEEQNYFAIVSKAREQPELYFDTLAIWSISYASAILMEQRLQALIDAEK